MRFKALFLCSFMLLLVCAAEAVAQEQQPPSVPDAPAASATAPTLFPHSDKTRYLVLGQANIIFQAHAPFHSPYSGPNSLQPRGEYKTSLLGTLYLAYQINRNPRFATDAILDVESSGGRGISQALGLAGFTNLDVVRNPSLGSKPYLARYQIHQVIGFGGKMLEAERTPFSLATSLPARRLDLHIGRMGLPDFIDVNSVGSDSHLQFLNWTADNSGAWDYAANTRGYTDALVAEYVDGPVTVRYALAAMPTVANGTALEHNFHRASGHNFELELRSSAVPGRKGALRLLGFRNAANMGVYRTQNALALAHATIPDITAHPFHTTVKYGSGLNFEQEVSSNARLYGRFGWNEGQHESYAYTEVDQTFAAGADYAMKRFGRTSDKAGVTVISNAIKRDHQAYLAAGGLGFLLGDGKLHYAREEIVESYYNLSAGHGIYYALDAQFVEHPGYNQDRGPVLVESVRMHVDF